MAASRIRLFAGLLCSVLLPTHALAWGDEGHQIIALVAQQYLEPATRAEVAAMLAADHDNLTAHDIASEATWADRYRDSDRDGSGERYKHTRQWHFVNIELDNPNLDQACHGHPPLPPGVPASRGPADACIVDKIDQFSAELATSSTDPEERLIALKFLLHFVGDVHQPLHASDDHDAGGNRKQVAGDAFTGSNLHHLWDTEFVERVGRDSAGTVTRLQAGILDAQRQAWARGTTADWAMESFALARDHAYGMLPAANADGVYVLSPAYIDTATHDAAVQLSKAGVRLAFVLNHAIAAAQQASH
jgi:S1/P1 Nuclease